MSAVEPRKNDVLKEVESAVSCCTIPLYLSRVENIKIVECMKILSKSAHIRSGDLQN